MTQKSKSGLFVCLFIYLPSDDVVRGYSHHSVLDGCFLVIVITSRTAWHLFSDGSADEKSCCRHMLWHMAEECVSAALYQNASMDGQMDQVGWRQSSVVFKGSIWCLFSKVNTISRGLSGPVTFFSDNTTERVSQPFHHIHPKTLLLVRSCGVLLFKSIDVCTQIFFFFF